MKRELSVDWSDPAIFAEPARSLAGIDFLKAICEGRLPQPPIARLMGFRLVEVDSGHTVFEVQPGEQHYNPIGVVHGGLAMTLLDSAMGCAVQSQVPAGKGYTTLEAKTNLVRPITLSTGRLRAIGKVLHFGSRVATAEGRLVDAAGKLYAHSTTTCIVLSQG